MGGREHPAMEFAVEKNLTAMMQADEREM